MASKPPEKQVTANEALVSIEIIRQILLMRFALKLRNEVVGVLNDTERAVASIIRDSLTVDAGLRSPEQVRRLEATIAQINAMRTAAWAQGQALAATHLTALAEAEPEDQRDIFDYILPGIALTVPMVTGLGATALSVPFQGRTLRQWFSDAAQDDAKRIQRTIYASVGMGEGPATVARRVVGTASKLGADGVTQISRNHIETIVRSATVHTTAYSRDQFYKANDTAEYLKLPAGSPRPPVRPVGGADSPLAAEARRQVAQALAEADRLQGFNNRAGRRARGEIRVFAMEQFVAILDSKTTKVCRRLDGKRFRIGTGPIPPLHMNCRSNRIIVLPVAIGGPVYDPGNYGQWIRDQPDAVKRALLGSTKSKKLTEADLAQMSFQDYGAKPMTLGQVRNEARWLMESY